MSQLDLFAPIQKDAVEAKTPVKPAGSTAVTDVDGSTGQNDVQPADNLPTIVLDIPVTVTDAIVANDIIFSDDKISVKIKQKKLREAIEPEPLVKAAKVPQKRGRKPLKEIPGEADMIEVPDDEELFKKQYYPISVVAQWFKVNTSLLRFWENEFDILKPRKNRKGDRLFRPEDIKNLQLIHHLLRHRKYSIEGAKEFLKGDKEKADAQLQITKTLLKLKGFLLELKAGL